MRVFLGNLRRFKRTNFTSQLQGEEVEERGVSERTSEVGQITEIHSRTIDIEGSNIEVERRLKVYV